jgi:tripartite-type tricarboxylate transporter receptor subunit TctC
MKTARSLGWLLAGLMMAAAAWAQDPAANYPSRPVRWVIPFTSGASNDIIGRLVGGKLSKEPGLDRVVRFQ